MSDAPLISVVIPVWNRGAAFVDTLDSVLGQTWPTFEVIVVDDGSTNDTPAVCRRYADQGRIRHIRQANAGTGAARNTGIRAARGTYIALLDHDDTWLPEKLARQAEVAAAHPQSGVIVCNGRHVRAAIGEPDAPLMSSFFGQEKRPNGLRVVTCNPYESFLYRNPISTLSQTLIPRQVFDEVGLLTEGRNEATDLELYLRIAMKFRFTFHNDALVHKQYLPESRSGPPSTRRLNWSLMRIATFQKHLAHCPVSQLAALRKHTRLRIDEVYTAIVDESNALTTAERRELFRRLHALAPPSPELEALRLRLFPDTPTTGDPDQ